MLLIKVTDHPTADEVVLTHEVKNEGKMTEEHHIRIHPVKGNVEGRPIAHYVLDKAAAAELKRHL
jgi:hypothetical protein